MSTSPWEGSPQAVVEGIASGCLPLVHRWPGAQALYAPLAHALWSGPDELTALIAAAGDAQAAANRRWVEHLSSAVVLPRIDAIVDRLVRAPPPGPTVSCCMVVKGDDLRFEPALDSLQGAWTELVCLVDTRCGTHNRDVALRRGAVALDRPLPLYHGAPDFAAARNRVAGHASGDWVLVIDADETVEGASLIRGCLADAQRRGHDAAAFRIECYTDRGLAEAYVGVRAYRNNGRIGYRYPVHNTLEGAQSVAVYEQVVVRSSYVGGLAARCRRALPALHALWEQSERGGDASKHAAYYLCRTYEIARDLDEVLSWAQVCEAICPADLFAAPFWSWYYRAVVHRRGVEAGRTVLERGLGHHPRHPDLLHARLTMDLLDWHSALQAPTYAALPLSSRRHARGIPRAIEDLGLDVNVKPNDAS